MRQQRNSIAQSMVGLLVFLLLGSGISPAQAKKLTLGYSTLGPAREGFVDKLYLKR